MVTRALFLHGGPGNTDYLEHFFADQFPGRIECVFYSQTQTNSNNVTDLIDEVGDFAKSDKDTVLVGHSWGGALAIEYLRQKTNLNIKGLVLIGSFVCSDDVTAEYEAELKLRKINNPSVDQVFFAPHEIKEAAYLIEQLNKKFNQVFFDRIWSEFAPTYDARRFIIDLNLPILNIFGGNDIRVPARRVRTYSELNNRIQNLEIKGAGHFPFILTEDRKTVSNGILNFIDAIAK